MDYFTLLTQKKRFGNLMSEAHIAICIFTLKQIFENNRD
jgi:hypothetical protein